MSSRTASEFGTLGERVTATPKPALERPVDPAQHVWVKTTTGRQPGLLVAWVRDPDGTWWGKVAVADTPGEASLGLIQARLLTPATSDTPTP